MWRAYEGHFFLVFEFVQLIKKMSSTESVAPAAAEVEQVETADAPCLPTKELMAACVTENGEMACVDLIRAHLECMEKFGVKI